VCVFRNLQIAKQTALRQSVGSGCGHVARGAGVRVSTAVTCGRLILSSMYPRISAHASKIDVERSRSETLPIHSTPLRARKARGRKELGTYGLIVLNF
jgi:hypothetical protein